MAAPCPLFQPNLIFTPKAMSFSFLIFSHAISPCLEVLPHLPKTFLSLKFHKPHYSKDGLWSSSMSITWELAKMQNLWPHSDLLNQKPHFNKISRWFLGTYILRNAALEQASAKLFCKGSDSESFKLSDCRVFVPMTQLWSCWHESSQRQ